MEKKKKDSRLKQFRRWYKQAQPSKKYFMITLITACIPAIFHVLEPIAAAKVITGITEAKYTAAIVWLVIVWGMIFLRNASWHINYWNFERLMGYSYMGISMKIYDKVVDANEENFKHTSKEKIVNIISNDIYTVSNFSNILSTKLSYFFRTIITIIVVFTSSPIAGAIIIAVSVLNYFLLNMSARHIGRYGKRVAESKDRLLEHISDVSETRTMIRDNNISDYHKEEYKKLIRPYIHARYKRTLWNSFVDNWVYVIWQAIVCVTSIYLVYLISGNALTLATYLVIVGYLAPTIEKVNSAYLLFKELDVADVAAGRIQTMLEFSPKELVEYGNRMTNKIDGSLELIDVCVDASNSYHTENVNNLTNFNMSVNKGDLCLLVGPKGCGKRSVFHILRRAIKPDAGKVILSGIDLYEYSPAVHAENIAYTTHKPHFFKGTIESNFHMYTKSKSRIKKACQLAGIYESIDSLPNKFNSDISEIEKWSAKEKYLLGLARALSLGSEVLMIYEFPSQLSMRDRAEVANIYKRISEHKAVIVFASTDDIAPLATKTIYISKGKVEKTIEN